MGCDPAGVFLVSWVVGIDMARVGLEALTGFVLVTGGAC